MRKKAVLALVPLLICGSLLSIDDAPNKKVTEFLGAPAIAILKAPDKVECFRIDPKGGKDGDENTIAGHAITARGAEQKAEFGSRIATVLFDEHTYNFESAKMCIFSPGVAFRVWKDKDYVDVLLCFSCDEVEVITPAAKGTDAKPHVAHEDFDRARGALKKLAQEAFPNDAEITKLK